MEKAFRTKRLLFVIFAIIISVLCTVCLVACGGDDKNSGSRLKYSAMHDDKRNIISYRVDGIGSETGLDIVIPSNYKGKPVTRISESAFRGYGRITSVKIGNNVKHICANAFRDCVSLTSIEIPDSVTSIENGAFENSAYYNDESNWENGVLYIGNHLISAKDTISGECTVKQDTLTIAEYAFYDCNSLTSVNMPDSVTSIGEGAFRGCGSLASAKMPDGITSIERDVFYKCANLTSIEIPTSVMFIEDYAFHGCSSLSGIEIPNSVLSIGDYAFRDCSSLANIEIPDSVMLMGIEPFNNTAYLQNDGNWIDGVLYIGKHLISAKTTISGEYTIRQGTLTIAGGAFNECSSLTNVYIPDSIVSVGDYVFLKCSLSSITFGGTMEHWQRRVAKALMWNDRFDSVKAVVCTDGTIEL
ncbi:MAG: leucine-rich repeat domain-containing protein [Clostridiales bacterium]|nr:leucine-rich repeat domain-containing protein [Clostridiales bacterium]